MKKSFYTILALLFVMSITNSVAQVTIGEIGVPNATLDVRSKRSDVNAHDGIIAPKLTGDELFAKNAAYGADQNGALVYVTAAASISNQTGKTVNVKASDYYYYDAVKSVWVAFAINKPEWFYMPPADLNVIPDTQPKTINLFNLYKNNITTKSISSDAGHPFTEFCPELTASDFYYYVIGYDGDVFRNIEISAAGAMTYEVYADATDKTYINVAFVRK